MNKVVPAFPQVSSSHFKRKSGLDRSAKTNGTWQEERAADDQKDFTATDAG
jgi:hypothetical protein